MLRIELRLPGRTFARISLLLTALMLTACSDLAAKRDPLISATISAPPTQTPTLNPTPTPTPPPTPTPTPSDLWIDPSGVRIHPDGGLYSGDTLSFEIEARNGGSTDLSRVPVVVDWGSDRAEGEIDTIPRGGSGTADLVWVWHTASLVGTQTVTITLDPENGIGDPDSSNNIAVVQIDLAADRPGNEIGAEWQTATSDCCAFHFIRGTAAARDIDAIGRVADDAIAYAEDRLGVQREDRLEVYLIGRVLGHGGFASEQIAISYLDRNYAGGGLLEVFRHEGTHLLDRGIAGGERPVLLVEGFATYITGGHFKLEPLPERAAALLQIDGYLPLRDLANHFYPSQHETGYLEAGAFIDYLVERDGYATFIELYDGMRRKPGESDADVIDREMKAVYDVGLDDMEAEWLAHLRTLDAGDQVRDVANTIAFYDTVRRYQRALDPSAYFLEVWMPDIQQAESRGLAADYLRHPRAPENIAIETMLVAADAAFVARDFDRVEALLASVNTVLDADATFSDPTAARYLAVVRATLASGHEPQRITLDGDRAEVLAARDGGSTLVSLSAVLQDDAWSVRLSQ
ncbi:MAG: hypothetical protein ACRDGG_01365 [Anaerolineae bacterium]